MRTYFLDKQFLTDREYAQLEAAFAGAGQELLFREWRQPQEVIDGAKDADAIILMAVHITADVMDAMPNLKVIGRCGIGVDNVDLDAATARGIVVCNVPDHCTYEVASHAFTMMLALERQLPAFIDRAKKGGYANGKLIKCHRIRGQVMGILGYGKIGRELAKMALGMGMQVMVYDPFVKETDEPGIALANMDTILRQADVISLHTPLLPSTYHMISMEQLKMMKPTAILLNASRGGVVNTTDLIEALKTGVIAAAGLDVIEGEPLPAGSELFDVPNLMITPHVGMYSEEAMEDMYNKLFRQTTDVLAGRAPGNVVNKAVLEKLALR